MLSASFSSNQDALKQKNPKYVLKESYQARKIFSKSRNSKIIWIVYNKGFADCIWKLHALIIYWCLCKAQFSGCWNCDSVQVKSNMLLSSFFFNLKIITQVDKFSNLKLPNELIQNMILSSYNVQILGPLIKFNCCNNQI